jgi:hypothetical protein
VQEGNLARADFLKTLQQKLSNVEVKSNPGEKKIRKTLVFRHFIIQLKIWGSFVFLISEEIAFGQTKTLPPSEFFDTFSLNLSNHGFLDTWCSSSGSQDGTARCR